MNTILRYRISLLFMLIGFSNAATSQLYFPPNEGAWQTTSIAELNWCPEQVDSLYAYLEANQTKAFLLLKDGKIVLERYFNGQDTSDVWYWASAGKTLTGFLVGIAQQQGYLDIDSTLSSIIGPGWSNCDLASEQQIRVLDQLSMTSGLDDAVIDPYCTLPECLQCIADPGTRWAYHNGPYTLLDSVIQVTTGLTLNQFFLQQVASSTGINGLFVDIDYNHVFFSTARNMAKFGLLLQAQGSWNSNPILNDQDYFNAMTSSSQDLNHSYGYLTWLNGQVDFMLPQSQFVFPGPMFPHAPMDTYAAMGRDGQFINVVPSTGMVWIRMGEEPQQLPVPVLMNDSIWARIQQLECTSAISESKEDMIRIYPNPTADCSVVETRPGDVLRVMDLFGRVVFESNCASYTHTITSSDLAPGAYQVLIDRKGKRYAARWLVSH
jgi:CubicO group peptidase (beta-lactamase class C family)